MQSHLQSTGRNPLRNARSAIKNYHKEGAILIMKLELIYMLAPPERWKRTEDAKGRTATTSKPIECVSLVTGDEDEATIREVRRVRDLAAHLTQAFTPVDALPPKSQRLFTLALDVSDVHTTNALYGLSRRRHDGCPAFVSEDAMKVYAQIKRVFRQNRLEKKARKERRHVAQKA